MVDALNVFMGRGGRRKPTKDYSAMFDKIVFMSEWENYSSLLTLNRLR